MSKKEKDKGPPFNQEEILLAARQQESPIDRYGYFIAKTDSVHMDLTCAHSAQFFFHCSAQMEKKQTIRKPEDWLLVEGGSCVVYKNGQQMLIAIVRNFFSGKGVSVYRVHYQHAGDQNPIHTVDEVRINPSPMA